MTEAPASRTKWNDPRLLLVATLLAVAAPARGQERASVTATPRVLIDRKLVNTAGRSTLMDLLGDHTRARRIGVNATDPAEQPLVIVDGVPIGPRVDHLKLIALEDVESVTLLTRSEAQMRYGQLASRGAVVIETRRGRASGRR